MYNKKNTFKTKKILVSIFTIFILTFNLFINSYAENSNNDFRSIIENSKTIKNEASKLKKDNSYEVIGSSSTLDETRTYEKNLDVGTSFYAKNSSLIVKGDLILGSSAKIDKDLIVYGNLKAGTSLEVKGNVTVTGDVELGYSSKILGDLKGNNIIAFGSLDVQRIDAKGYLVLGSSTSITNGVDVGKDLIGGISSDIEGKSKVLGNVTLGSSPNIKGLMYVYGNFKSGTSVDLKLLKLKITENIYIGSSGELEGRAYIYGKKHTGISYSEKLKNYTGFFGKIDPILDYTLPEAKIITIKNRTDNYLFKASQIQSVINSLKAKKYPDIEKINIKKTEKYNIYVQMFDYLEPFIEKEQFDRNIFSRLKKEYVGNKIVTIEDNPYKPYISYEMRIKLNNILENMPENKKREIFNKALPKIDNFIIKFKNKGKTSKNIKVVNFLLGLKEVLEQKMNEL